MINRQNLIDEANCYETVREWRWPEGVRCPHCDSAQMTKPGRDSTQGQRPKYSCKGCHHHVDGLTETVFAGHPHPLRRWILGFCLRGLNLSTPPLAQELGLNKDDVQSMPLSDGVVARRLAQAFLHQVHVNTLEGFWSLWRSWRRPHRGLSQQKLYLGFFEFVHNLRIRGKSLLRPRLELLPRSLSGVHIKPR